MSYPQDYRRSLAEPADFWAEQARDLDWFRAPRETLRALDDGTHRWFADALLNTAYLALDRHVENGRGEQPALLYDSPVSDVKRQYSYRQLRDEVARLAGALRALGVGKGDRVVIYMPMVPEAAMAMLACARLGAVHSVVFGGFAPQELAVRIDDARPKLLLTASCGIEFDRVIPYQSLVEKALALAEHPPQRVMVLQRPQAPAALRDGRDLDWAQQVAQASPVEPVPVLGGDPLYILYTSGTTGRPKGIVRDNAGHAVALRYCFERVYGMRPGDVWWGLSDIGWVVGHSMIVYGPLMAGCSTVFYEGKPVRTPDAGAIWRMIEEYRVNALTCAPTAIRAVRKEDPSGERLARHDLSSLRALFLAGERLDSSTHQWLEEQTARPVHDHWWQTETGWPVTAPCVGLADYRRKVGSSNAAVPGYHVLVVNEEGELLDAGQEGAIVVSLPLPPGCAQTLWNDSERYRQAYLQAVPGHYLTGDGGYLDADGFVYVMGRTDDVINVAGHRLSTGEMEDRVARHPAVAECAVIGVPDDLKGQLPLALVVCKEGVAIDPAALQAELVARVREELGALACFQQVRMVRRLPKTRSGKILRAVLRKIAAGEPYAPPATIDDPAILEELAGVLRGELSAEAP